MPPARKPARPLAPPEEVAEYLDVPLATLKHWRRLKIGPHYSHVGKHVRYDWADVDAYLKENYVECGKSAGSKRPAA
jgi:hypothetical protein